jgi:hypothetical protein
VIPAAVATALIRSPLFILIIFIRLNNSFVSEEAACEVVELILKSLGHKVITKEIMAYL